MKLYIAASFTKRDQARELRDRLIEHGFIITSRWLDGTYSAYGKGSSQAMEEFSAMDLQDVTNAHALVQITGDTETKGGRHTELGIALAQGKNIFLLGPREQVFHYHFTVSQSNEVDELIALLVGFRRLEEVR